jgi:small subunit ribosomal protein S6
MKMNHYECLVLFDTSKLSGNQEAAKATVNGTLQKYGCEILASRNWDERKLAYPIEGQKKGLYYLAYFKADSSKIDPIQGDFKINESILRFLTIKIPAKWEDEMSSVAKDETRLAYQALREDVENTDPTMEGMGDDMGGRRERRGRREEPMKD